MGDAVLAAAITAAASVLCQMLISKQNSKMVVYRVDQLEKKVEKHNNFIERLTRVEDRAKSNTHRLDKLDGEGGE